MKGCYIQENKLVEGEEVNIFSVLLDLEWKCIFYSAQLMCEQRRQNLRKPGDMPLEKDLTTFRNNFIEQTTEMRNILVSRLTYSMRGEELARMEGSRKE